MVLVLPSLTAGGAQRVIAKMANHWANHGWKVCVVTLSDDVDDFFTLDPSVVRDGLAVTSVSQGPLAAVVANRRRVRRLRTAIRMQDPQVVISFVDQTNVLALLATRRLGIPTIVAERTDPRHHPLGRVWSRLRRWTYPGAAAVVVQTESVATHLRSRHPHCVLRVIPNGVEPAQPVVRSQHDPLTVCAVGRLSWEKGFDRLIEAFGTTVDDFPTAQLVIYGDGPERDRLETLASHCAPERVRFAGWVTDLGPAFAGADIFCLPSRYEGFPNALLEAMVQGLAVVSFDCESGPGEIVENGVNGILVPPDDTTALANAMRRLLGDAQVRQQLGERASRVSEQFSYSRFFQRWDALLDEVT